MSKYPAITYKSSASWLIFYLVIDFVLIYILIGIFFLIKHLIHYLTSHLQLTDNSVILKTGWLNVKTIEIPYAKVNSVSTRVNIIGKIFGYGDIVILSGNDISGQVFENIDQPEAVKQEIMHRVNPS